jgi:hypothetical protein
MNNLVAKRSQIVEAQFTGSLVIGRKYPFTQDPNISRKNIIIYGFEAYSNVQLDFTPINNVVIDNDAITDVVITFIDNNNIERIYQLPYTCLMPNLNGGFIRLVKPFTIDLTKSYVQLVDTSNVSIDESIAINLYYTFVGE